ncbi:head maturation protease, ClpP-related [Tenacibaculum maritimum]|nr:head maturation protease, ClpP-related [Tenacibaculum maritimum]CAA0211094.1 ATP-dependent Clp endopeptidase, proteolytic subunit ClpP [Tenacibaculum maritimum]
MEFSIDNNIITALGDIQEGDGTKFISVLSKVEKAFDEITIKLHTYGGSVFDGNLIYNEILGSSSEITIHIIGVSASMGAIIALSIEEVYMVENGYVMIHAPSGGVYGTADDMENQINLLRSIEENFTNKLEAKTGKERSYVEKWLSGDNWFSAKQALEEGLIKGILGYELEVKANFDPSKIPIKEAFSRFTALFDSKKNKTKNMNLRQELIEKFKLKANSSDTKIMYEIEENEQFRLELLEILNLDSDVSNEDIISAIKKLQEIKHNINKEEEEEAEKIIEEAIVKRKINPNQRKYIKNMFKNDFKGTKEYLNNIRQAAPNITSLIKRSKFDSDLTKNSFEKPKSEWDLEDYRKYAPNELANNPKLYKSLKEAKFNQ